MVELLRATMELEAFEAQPPQAIYKRCAELTLTQHYAIPICMLGSKPTVNPVDGIVEALSTGERAFEIVAPVGDGCPSISHQQI